MSRIDYTVGLVSTGGLCANRDGRQGVAYVDGRLLCSSCLGRGNPSQQFRPPQSNVGSSPNERRAMSRQQQMDFVAAAVARCLPKGTPHERSMLEAAVRRRVSQAGSEQTILSALVNCKTKADVEELLRLIEEKRKPR